VRTALNTFCAYCSAHILCVLPWTHFVRTALLTFCAYCPEQILCVLPEHIVCVLPCSHSFYKLCKIRYQGAAPTAVQLHLLLFSCTYCCSAAPTAVQLHLLLLSTEFQEIRRKEGTTRVPWHRTVQSLESSESLSKVCTVLSTSWNVPTDRQTDRHSGCLTKREPPVQYCQGLRASWIMLGLIAAPSNTNCTVSSHDRCAARHWYWQRWSIVSWLAGSVHRPRSHRCLWPLRYCSICA